MPVETYVAIAIFAGFFATFGGIVGFAHWYTTAGWRNAPRA